jgi:hypothetical protein
LSERLSPPPRRLSQTSQPRRPSAAGTSDLGICWLDGVQHNMSPDNSKMSAPPQPRRQRICPGLHIPLLYPRCLRNQWHDILHLLLYRHCQKQTSIASFLFCVIDWSSKISYPKSVSRHPASLYYWSEREDHHRLAIFHTSTSGILSDRCLLTGFEV